MWALNRTNFGCNLFEQIDNVAAKGSVLDKLDHTRRLEMVAEEKKHYIFRVPSIEFSIKKEQE
jgi:hypothetical protein